MKPLNCCSCKQVSTHWFMVMIDMKGPAPGKGWGCFQCGLADDGAVAVQCLGCFEKNAPLIQACADYFLEQGRVPIELLRQPFEHNLAMHPEIDQPTGAESVLIN